MSGKGETFKLLEDLPLFSLTNAVPENVNFKKMMKGWPQEKLSLLESAQAARDLMVQHLKVNGMSMQLRLNDIDKYLPLALSMENELKENPNIKPTSDNKFTWMQAPIVNPQYQLRSFNGQYFSNEVLHIVWLHANLMLNEGYLISSSGDYDKCVALFREMAGIFNYLAGDRLRVICGEAVPIEFKPPIFQSLTNLALAQAYACILAKAERDGLKPVNLAKIAYTVATTLESSTESFNTSEPKDAFNPQYPLWLQCQTTFFHALSAIYLGFHNKRLSKQGVAISLVRVGLSKLETIVKTPKCHERILRVSKNLLEKVTELNQAWSEENFMVMNELVPTPEDSEATIAATCTIMPNLPQPIPYIMPDSSIVNGDADADAIQPTPMSITGPSRVKKIIPPPK